MPLPNSNLLEISLLSQIYKNTSATYKFYWFISILELHCFGGKKRISFWEIIVQMIANAWYPIHYFRLSFGKADSLYQEIIEIQKITGLPIDADKRQITETLLNNIDNPLVLKHLRIFSLNVPYRFLSPWISYSNDADVISRSQKHENNCPYAIEIIHNEKFISINPHWGKYLQEHCRILLDYSYWNLALFLQTRNPNVPDIPNKLIKQIERSTLTKQRNFWNSVITETGPIRCIYTHKPLEKGNFAVEHFIPWSFVSHDLLWNLLPADASINSSKSNKLPDINAFLPQFATEQQHAIQTIFRKNPNNQLLEDYQNLGAAVYDLVELSTTDFYTLYYKTMSPLIQIAENMGFEKWNFQPTTQ